MILLVGRATAPPELAAEATVLVVPLTRPEPVVFQFRKARYDWLLLTSAAVVPAVVGVVATHVAAVGEATAHAARAAGFVVDVVGTGTGAQLVAQLPLVGASVVWPTAETPAPATAEALRGVDVDQVAVYRTVAVPGALPAHDLAVLYAPSAVSAYVERGGRQPIVAVGPTTAERAIGHGLEVAAVAEFPTPAGIVAAVQRVRRR